MQKIAQRKVITLFTLVGKQTDVGEWCVQVDNKTRSALDHWRTIVINDDPHRPISKYYLGGLTPLTRYQVEIKVDNYMGASADTSFVFVTSEGLLLR